MPINIALLGGGIFATEAHIPALARLVNQAHLKAVWSRSHGSAQRGADAWKQSSGKPVSVYSETGEKGQDLKALLADSDIHAVITALPFASQPDIIFQALAAGKHVLSEKPVATDVAVGKALLAQYNKDYRSKGLIWRVAENWEVEPAHIFVGEAVKTGRIGRVHDFFVTSVLFVDNEGNKYFETEWRKTPQFQGGYLLDAGVHNAGVLRTVLPEPLSHLSAYTTLNNEHLPPTDYLTAIARTAGGIQGQIMINYGARGREPIWELRLSGTDGEIFSQDVVENGVESIKVEIRRGKFGRDETETKAFPKSGVFEEQKRFFEAIVGSSDQYGSVEGALSDVALLEAALKSKGSERPIIVD